MLNVLMAAFRAFQIWIARVRVGEASHPGPGSRFFVLTEMDTNVEDEDHDGVIPEAPPVEIHRRGARRLVIVGAQIQVDPVVPTTLDEEWDRSDTESIESRGGTSDAVGEMEVEPILEPPVPAVASLSGIFSAVFQVAGGSGSGSCLQAASVVS